MLVVQLAPDHKTKLANHITALQKCTCTLCCRLYSTSILLTVVAALNVLFSLQLTYFTYTWVLRVHFFPFMNLLAVLILIGVGFDDIFIYCKVRVGTVSLSAVRTC